MSNWPQGVSQLCQILHSKQQQINLMIQISLQEGVDEQNYSLIPTLLPIIAQRCQELRNNCKEILSYIPKKRRGRYPKWITTTMDVSALADRILQRCEAIDQQYKQNLIITVARLLEQAQQDAQAIETRLEALPCDDIPVPEVFRDAFKD